MKQYSHAIPIAHGLPPGPLWPRKHDMKELKAMEEADPYTFSAQMQQEPAKEGGVTFRREWWQFYEVLPDYEWKALLVDTALKAGEHNDYTVFQCWAKYQNKIYLVDQFREKVESVHLEKVFIDFWNKHNTSTIQPLRLAWIEDKVSGTTLIQQILKRGGIPVEGIPRHKSKAERSFNLVPWIKSGLVFLPTEAPWIHDYLTEFQSFSPNRTHRNDDQIDPTLDAIEKMLVDCDTESFFKESGKEPDAKTLAPPIHSKKLW